MTDKEKIKQEIERRFNDNIKASEQYTENSKSRALFTSAAKEDYDLLAFIDSIPEEPVSKDLEEEINTFFADWLIDLDEHKDFVQIAHHFAEWQKDQMMKDAVECTWGTEATSSFMSDFPNIECGDKVKVIIVKED